MMAKAEYLAATQLTECAMLAIVGGGDITETPRPLERAPETPVDDPAAPFYPDPPYIDEPVLPYDVVGDGPTPAGPVC